MSQRCPSLEGTEYFAFDVVNPPSPVQFDLIEVIRSRMGISFQGSTSEEAYEFIGDHYEYAKHLPVSY